MSDAASALEREAEACLTAEKWEDGLVLADRAAAENPASELAQRLRFVALQNLDRGADAIAAARRAIELAPTKANAHYLLATALLAAHDDAGALHAIERAIELEDDVPQYWRFHLRVLMHHDQSRVEAAVLAIGERAPLTADLLNLLGCFAERRSLAEAKTLYTRALSADGSREDARHNLRRVFWRSVPRTWWGAAVLAVIILPLSSALAVGIYGATSGLSWVAWCAPLVALVGFAASVLLLARARRTARAEAVWTIDR